MRFTLLSRLSALALFFTVASATAFQPALVADTQPVPGKKADVDKKDLKEPDPSDVKKPVLNKADGQYKVAPGKSIRIIVTYSGEGLGRAESFTPDDDLIFEEFFPTKKGEKRYLFSPSKAGTYTITFWNKGADTGVVATIVVSGTGDKPTPGPGPGSGPVKTVLFVTDTTSPPLLIAHITAVGIKLSPTLTGMQIKFGGVDKENPGVDGKPGNFAHLIEAAKKDGGYPHYFFLDSENKVLESGMMDRSTTADSLLEKIKLHK